MSILLLLIEVSVPSQEVDRGVYFVSFCDFLLDFRTVPIV